MEKRKVASTRFKPSILKKLDSIVDHLNIDTSFWGRNEHTRKLGYWCKSVTRADVLEILINKGFDEIQNYKINQAKM